jgi:hypothetical protein
MPAGLLPTPGRMMMSPTTLRKHERQGSSAFIPDPILPRVEAACLYIPASDDKSSGLCNGLRSDLMV